MSSPSTTPGVLPTALLVSALVAAVAAPVIAQTSGDASSRLLRDAAIGAPAVPLQPPPPRPPAGLAEAPGSPLARARLHLADTDVLDALAVRASRRLDLLVDGLPDADGCRAARASWSALDLAADEAGAHQLTAAALLQSSSDAEARATADGLARRLDHLRAERARLGAALAAGNCAPPPPAAADPRVFLPEDRRGPREGRVAVFVRSEPQANVVWVDGRPAAVAGPSGWSAVVVPVGGAAVCAAAPEATACADRVAIDAEMGAAFELTAPKP